MDYGGFTEPVRQAPMPQWWRNINCCLIYTPIY